jgi:hypothetical protein
MAKVLKSKPRTAAKPAKSPAPPKTPPPDPSSLDYIFITLQTLLEKHAPPFKPAIATMDGRRDYHLMVPQTVVIQGSYGNKPTEIAMASIVLQKDFVGFYFMPIYLNPELKKRVPPTLLKLLKGKTCFHVKSIDDQLLIDVQAALDLGRKSFKDRDWIV